MGVKGGKRNGAGRKVGSVGQLTEKMRFDILATLRANGFDPLERLLWCYDEAKTLYREAREDHTRKSDGEHTQNHWLVNSRLQMMLQASQDLMEYVYPKRKSIELTGAGGEDLFLSFAEMVRKVHSDAKNAAAIEVEANHIADA